MKEAAVTGKTPTAVALIFTSSVSCKLSELAYILCCNRQAYKGVHNLVPSDVLCPKVCPPACCQKW